MNVLKRLFYVPLDVMRYLMDWVFPAYCDSCGEGKGKDELLCAKCRDDLRLVEVFTCCKRCGKPLFGAAEEKGEERAGDGMTSSEAGKVDDCAECRGKRLYMDGVNSLYLNQGKAHELVLLLKYAKGLHLARLFGRELAAYRERKGLSSEVIVVPVPQSIKSRLKRGYNQAEEISRVFAQRLGLPHAALLAKALVARSQTQMNRRDRWTVNRGTIKVRRSYAKKAWLDAQFLLIDDVCTTGATLNECARVLKKAFPGCTVTALTVLRS